MTNDEEKILANKLGGEGFMLLRDEKTKRLLLIGRTSTDRAIAYAASGGVVADGADHLGGFSNSVYTIVSSGKQLTIGPSPRATPPALKITTYWVRRGFVTTSAEHVRFKVVDGDPVEVAARRALDKAKMPYRGDENAVIWKDGEYVHFPLTGWFYYGSH